MTRDRDKDEGEIREESEREGEKGKWCDVRSRWIKS